MSHYIFKARNRQTGEVITVNAIDDYYGKHEYGMEVNGKVYPADDAFEVMFERIEAVKDGEFSKKWLEHKGIEQANNPQSDFIVTDRLHVAMLRDWFNEKYIKDKMDFITSEDILTFLKK